MSLEEKVTAQSLQTVYVAVDQEACESFSPCYINSAGVDGPDGLGTGLREAVNALNPGDEIIILGNYPIKDHTVLIDKNLSIRGNENAAITYSGTDCSSPMLKVTAGGLLQKLTFTGGNCAGVSRDLISVDTLQDFRIENNTLKNGNRGISITQNNGNIIIAFNQIINNQEYAIYQSSGSADGTLEIFANNLFSNQTGFQVNCSDQGSADHNYWGEGILPGSAVQNCEVSNGKRLGAPILTEPDVPGVQAIRQNVTGDFSYAFENNIGVKHNSGNNYDLVIVNHGQGNEENIPFLTSGSDPIIACSNIYDVFLTNDAAASDLVLSITYDLNNTCINAVESPDFCDQNDSSKYPLWWYDPQNDLTGGWDRTGQIPEGDNPLNVEGQITTCNMSENNIEVIIDNSGHPGISKDLDFTPFLAGLPVGISNITDFDALFDVDQVDVYWETALESRISGYYVLRANSETGPYYRISTFIPSNGSNSFYEFTDSLSSAEFNKNYHYKIEIINTFGDILRTHGTISIITSTPTPSPTPTRTLYPTRTPYPTSTTGPTRTATLYYYRSPTPIYQPFTATPYGTPTQVRTDRPTPTGPSPTNLTAAAEQTGTLSVEALTETAQSELTRNASSSSPAAPGDTSRTPSPVKEIFETDEANPTPTRERSQGEINQINTLFLLAGAGLGFVIIITASLYLLKFI